MWQHIFIVAIRIGKCECGTKRRTQKWMTFIKIGYDDGQSLRDNITKLSYYQQYFISFLIGFGFGLGSRALRRRRYNWNDIFDDVGIHQRYDSWLHCIHTWNALLPHIYAYA